MSKSGTLRFVHLVDWIDGRLSGEEAQAVARQVARSDEATRADVAWLRAFRQVSQDTILATPPRRVRAQLVRRFETYAQDRRPAGLRQRLIATLTFDSYLQAGLVGVRGSGGGAGRQLIYSTDWADVLVNVFACPPGQRLDVYGQVLPREAVAPDAFSIQLVAETGEVMITSADDLGEFTWEKLVPGVYDMHVSADQVEILIAAIELQL